MMQNIYISGRISGLPIEVARARFNAAEQRIHERYPEAKIWNPMQFTYYEEGKPWQHYIQECLAILEACDTIVMLPNWIESNGAQCEYYYARGMHLQIFHYAEWLQDSK